MKNVMIILLFFSILAFCTSVFAINSAAFYNEGNANYSKGKFNKALENYKKVIESGINSADLYYNTGNAYFKLDKVGWARFFWEKALALDPRDSDIKYNIEYLKLNKLKDRLKKDESGNVFALIYESISLKSWYMVFIILYIVTCMSLGIRFILRREGLRFTLMIIFIVGFILLTYSGLNLYFKNADNSLNRKAVIVSKEISVKSEPGNNMGVELFTLHEGTLIRMVESRSNWYKIIAGEKLIGWIRKEDSKLI
ncbi:tetratricopeptide repeat protein [bacterium]|nr:tetratricopeptide repeat protein [bacterium]